MAKLSQKPVTINNAHKEIVIHTYILFEDMKEHCRDVMILCRGDAATKAYFCGSAENIQEEGVVVGGC